MIGQTLRDAVEVAVIAVMPDGTHVGWRVLNPTHVSWTHTGLVDHSSHARLVIEGEFHRKVKDLRSYQIEAAMNDAVLDHPTLPGLGPGERKDP